FFIPTLGYILLYALLAWFMLSIFVYRLPVMSRPLFGRGSAPTTSVQGPPFIGTPLTSTPGGTQLTFCAFCATSVEPGTPMCPACGHAIPVF
ncbi:MAG: hypothetical protein L3K06_04170, partial [Thermoplasmata archaeon]|nr:hypothetical protein [Thermoplasmata archaeon]